MHNNGEFDSSSESGIPPEPSLRTPPVVIYTFWYYGLVLKLNNYLYIFIRTGSLLSLLRLSFSSSVWDLDLVTGACETVPDSWAGLGACSPLVTLLTSLALILSCGSSWEADIADFCCLRSGVVWFVTLYVDDYWWRKLIAEVFYAWTREQARAVLLFSMKTRVLLRLKPRWSAGDTCYVSWLNSYLQLNNIFVLCFSYCIRCRLLHLLGTK